MRQECKRDLFFQDRDKTKTFKSLFEMRPRRFSRCRKRYSRLSFWLQTATNYPAFRSFITQNTVQYQQLSYRETFAPFSQRLSAI